MADNLQHTRVSELLSMQIGQAGVDVISNTAAHTPYAEADEWFAIQAVGDAEIAALEEQDATVNGTESTGTHNGDTLADGAVLFGTFTSITLTSGKVRCYREPKS